MTETIAIPYDNGSIDQHFGHAAQYKIYDVENGAITASRVIEDEGEGHARKIATMLGLRVTTVICGGIGMPAIEGMQKKGIEIYTSISGDADEAVKQYLAGGLPHIVKGHTHGAGGCHHEH